METLVERISKILVDKNVDFYEKKMFGGISFMVDDKMCLGLAKNKGIEEFQLMCRVGEIAYEKALEKPFASPMIFTGKEMKGYVFVDLEGLKKDSELNYWVQLCLDFNPLAQKSKKKKPKA